jgi:hypothetical protein
MITGIALIAAGLFFAACAIASLRGRSAILGSQTYSRKREGPLFWFAVVATPAWREFASPLA